MRRASGRATGIASTAKLAIQTVVPHFLGVSVASASISYFYILLILIIN